MVPPIIHAEFSGDGRGMLLGNWEISKDIWEGIEVILYQEHIEHMITARRWLQGYDIAHPMHTGGLG